MVIATKIDNTVICDSNVFQQEIIDFYDDIIDNEEHEEIDLLDATFSNPSAGFKCEICDFMAKSESGLKIHTKKYMNRKTD